MARVGKLQRLVKLVREHWFISIWLGVVAFAAGYVAISTFVETVRRQLAPEPVPEVIQVAKAPFDSEAYNAREPRWIVTIMNRTDEPMAITEAHYKTSRFPSTVDYQMAMETKLSRNVYRLPLNCQSGTGSRPLVPPFSVPPKSSGSLVIVGDKKDRDCFFLLSFETTQGRTKVMTADPF